MKLNQIIEGVIKIYSSGSGNFYDDEGLKIYVYKKNISKALSNDRVKIQLIEGKTKGTLEGKVIEVVKRNREEYTGIVMKRGKTGFLLIDDKSIHIDFYLTENQCRKYEIGERLLVKIAKWRSGKKPECKVIKSLGMVGENDSEINSIIYQYDLETEFPKTVEEESEKIDWEITEEEISKRKDFRKVTTFTIDPDTSRDFDDAISFKKLKNSYEIGIHIADVSHYVKKGSVLDEEAIKRSTSVYLVDRVIPMLPERLSNGICSLRPNEEKLAFSVVVTLDKEGRISDKWIGKTVIESDNRFTYDEVQEIIEGKDDKYKEEILILNDLAQTIRSKRQSLDINRSEVRFHLDEDQNIEDISVEEGNESHELIEEFMLLANRIIGKKLNKDGIGVYRNHDEPNEEKLLILKDFARSIGHDLQLADVKKGLNKLNEDVRGTVFENTVSLLSTRSMDKAEYSKDNIGHYGLEFDFYSHFTSPIRRYADLICHRILMGEKYTKDELDKACDHINRKEIVAKKAQRDSVKYKQVEYVLPNVGKVVKGTITGMKNFGVFVELDGIFCEGLVSNDFLKGIIDQDKYTVNLDDGRKFRLGDSVMVKIFSASMLKREINLEFI